MICVKGAFLMGYRLLLKKYMAHVEASSGETWLYPERQDCNLSRRDLVELRRLFDELRRDELLSNTPEQNFNVIARDVCAQLKLDATSVAEKLAWPQHLIERWLLEPGHSDYKAMTPRDFEHFSSCLGQHNDKYDSLNSSAS
tara:strand:- start:611 stop:1036 length:426 start_codon:yes stop_codon:yes gene_type:complete